MTSNAFLFVLKIVESLHCILKPFVTGTSDIECKNETT